MKNEVWKPSWSDLWAKSVPTTTQRRPNDDFGLHFGDQNPLKIVIFRHRFLDAFLGGIFNGFGRVLDLILEAFGMPNGAKNGKGQNMKNLCFTYIKCMFSRFQAIKIGMKIYKKSDPGKECVLG